MTLAIVHKTQNGILSISDTQLTFADSHKENPYFGALKSHILTPNISFHFAGNTHWAEIAIKRIEDLLHKNNQEQDLFKKIIEQLVKTHDDAKHDTDFILANSLTDTICKISNGSVLPKCEKAYIGDSTAYQLFTEHLSEDIENLKKEFHGDNLRFLYFCALGDAFKKVVNNETIDTVNGFEISIMQTANFFAYQQKVAVVPGPSKMKIGPEPTIIPFGNVQKGSFSINILSSGPGCDPQILGAHLFFGNIGCLWAVGNRIRPIVLTNCTHEILIAKANRMFGSKIGGIKIN